MNMILSLPVDVVMGIRNLLANTGTVAQHGELCMDLDRQMQAHHELQAERAAKEREAEIARQVAAGMAQLLAEAEAEAPPEVPAADTQPEKTNPDETDQPA
jgi:hypothetical protein